MGGGHDAGPALKRLWDDSDCCDVGQIKSSTSGDARESRRDVSVSYTYIPVYEISKDSPKMNR